MHDRVFSDLVEHNPEIERLIHVKPDNQMAENFREPPRQMKEYFISSTYNLSMFPSFYGIKHSDFSPKIDLNLIAQKLNKVDLLIDKFLALDQQSPAQYIPPPNYQEIYSICASPVHHVSEFFTTAQFLPFIQE